MRSATVIARGGALVVAALLLLAVGCDAKWANSFKKGDSAPKAALKVASLPAAARVERNVLKTLKNAAALRVPASRDKERKLQEGYMCDTGKYKLTTCTTNAEGETDSTTDSFFSDATCATASGTPAQTTTMEQMDFFLAMFNITNPYTGCMLMGDMSMKTSCSTDGKLIISMYNGDCEGMISEYEQGCVCDDSESTESNHDQCDVNAYKYTTCTATAEGGIASTTESFFADDKCTNPSDKAASSVSAELVEMTFTMMGQPNPYTTCLPMQGGMSYILGCSGDGKLVARIFGSASCEGTSVEQPASDCECDDDDGDYSDYSEGEGVECTESCEASPTSCPQVGALLAEGGCAAPCMESMAAFMELNADLLSDPSSTWVAGCEEYKTAYAAVQAASALRAPPLSIAPPQGVAHPQHRPPSASPPLRAPPLSILSISGGDARVTTSATALALLVLVVALLF